MGATDAIGFTRAWAARAQELGAVVDFEPGWDTRGNGMAANYEGGLVHHTAMASSERNPFPARRLLIEGRTDLRGPLCNVAGPWCPPDAPRLVVISARPANHAGASGGRSMGPLPVTPSFNSRVFGLEIDYAGVVPMASGQYRAAAIFARAVADVLGRSLEYVRAHAETSVTGKWDPGYAMDKTIDMASFRRDAAQFVEDDMPLTTDEIERIAEAVWRSSIKAREGIGPAPARDFLQHAAVYATRAAQEQAPTPAAASGPVDLDALAELIVEKLGSKLQS